MSYRSLYRPTRLSRPGPIWIVPLAVLAWLALIGVIYGLLSLVGGPL